MNQLVLGALIPFVLGLAWWRLRRHATLTFLILWPLAMGAGALWAVLPDIPRLLGRPELYHRLAHDPRMDVFLFHYTIDGMETDSVWGYALLVLIGIALQCVALWELRRRSTVP